jgi:WD40 repeat protein
MLSFQAHGKAVLSLAFSPDGQRLATVSKEPNVRVWGAAYDRPLFTCPCKTTTWSSLTFSPDGRHIAHCGKFGAEVWPLETRPTRRKIDTFAAQQCCYSPDGAVFMLASHSQPLRRWRTSDWAPLPSLGEGRTDPAGHHCVPLGRMALHPDGRLIAIL